MAVSRGGGLLEVQVQGIGNLKGAGRVGWTTHSADIPLRPVGVKNASRVGANVLSVIGLQCGITNGLDELRFLPQAVSSSPSWIISVNVTD
jgi:hypothetical protein